MEKSFKNIMVTVLLVILFITGTEQIWAVECFDSEIICLNEDPNVPEPEAWINNPVVYLSEDPNVRK